MTHTFWFTKMFQNGIMHFVDEDCCTRNPVCHLQKYITRSLSLVRVVGQKDRRLQSDSSFIWSFWSFLTPWLCVGASAQDERWKMKSEQKYRLAKWSITLAYISVTFIAIIWLTLAYSPSHMKGGASIKNAEVTIECDFTKKSRM